MVAVALLGLEKCQPSIKMDHYLNILRGLDTNTSHPHLTAGETEAEVTLRSTNDRILPAGQGGRSTPCTEGFGDPDPWGWGC